MLARPSARCAPAAPRLQLGPRVTSKASFSSHANNASVKYRNEYQVIKHQNIKWDHHQNKYYSQNNINASSVVVLLAEQQKLQNNAFKELITETTSASSGILGLLGLVAASLIFSGSDDDENKTATYYTVHKPGDASTQDIALLLDSVFKKCTSKEDINRVLVTIGFVLGLIEAEGTPKKQTARALQILKATNIDPVYRVILLLALQNNAPAPGSGGKGDIFDFSVIAKGTQEWLPFDLRETTECENHVFDTLRAEFDHTADESSDASNNSYESVIRRTSLLQLGKHRATGNEDLLRDLLHGYDVLYRTATEQNDANTVNSVKEVFSDLSSFISSDPNAKALLKTWVKEPAVVSNDEFRNFVEKTLK